MDFSSVHLHLVLRTSPLHMEESGERVVSDECNYCIMLTCGQTLGQCVVAHSRRSKDILASNKWSYQLLLFYFQQVARWSGCMASDVLQAMSHHFRNTIIVLHNLFSDSDWSHQGLGVDTTHSTEVHQLGDVLQVMSCHFSNTLIVLHNLFGEFDWSHHIDSTHPGSPDPYREGAWCTRLHLQSC